MYKGHFKVVSRMNVSSMLHMILGIFKRLLKKSVSKDVSKSVSKCVSDSVSKSISKIVWVGLVVCEPIFMPNPTYLSLVGVVLKLELTWGFDNFDVYFSSTNLIWS